MMRSFAIEEAPSPLSALYATLASDDDDWDDHRDDIHDGDQVDDVGCGDRQDDHLENFSRIDDISIICRSSSALLSSPCSYRICVFVFF